MTIHFTVLGKPHGKERPRFNRKTGHTYTPKKSVAYEESVKAAAAPHFSEMIEGAVDLTILATFKTPKSWTKAKTAEHLHRPHTQKPDGDNIAKSIKDALKGIAYEDDAHVSDHTVRKVWGLVDKVEVFVKRARFSAGYDPRGQE